MKKLMLIGMLLALTACQNAVVISADGTTEVAHCMSSNAGGIPICVLKACPNGSYTLKNADQIGGDTVMRCLDKPTDAK